jgi:hypothetical protein
MMRKMSDDPSGLYARLDVDPAAPHDAIAAAYRRLARVLHPDVPRTGDAEAFMRLKAAYDVLGDAERRAAYDRTARAAAEPAPPPLAEPPTRGPRLSDLPVALWAGLGGLACLASVMALVQLSRAPPPPSHPVARPFAPSVAADTSPPPPPPSSAAVPAAGAATHYVVPAGAAAVLWRRGTTRDAFAPVGHLGAFSPVQALGLVPQHGLVEIRLADGSSGFVDAARLTSGDSLTAHRAYCAYNAGPSPQNGEVLEHLGAGPARLEITNRGGEPAVVKLRNMSGKAAATVFVAPGGTAAINLPDGRYQPEFAIGELWSRACNDFAAGTRAQRYAGYTSPFALSPLVIPPDLSVDPPPVDIPDAAFERE